MKIVEDLRKLGYDIKVNEGKIKYAYQGKGNPDKANVLPLLEALKENRRAVIDELTCMSEDKLLMLKPCKYCGRKSAYEEAGEYYFLGCKNEGCKGKPEVYFKLFEKREVFENWNFYGGDVFLSKDKQHVYLGAATDKLTCVRCGKSSERFCLGDTGKQWKWGRFCLECNPYHF